MVGHLQILSQAVFQRKQRRDKSRTRTLPPTSHSSSSLDLLFLFIRRKKIYRKISEVSPPPPAGALRSFLHYDDDIVLIGGKDHDDRFACLLVTLHCLPLLVVLPPLFSIFSSITAAAGALLLPWDTRFFFDTHASSTSSTSSSHQEKGTRNTRKTLGTPAVPFFLSSADKKGWAMRTTPSGGGSSKDSTTCLPFTR